MAVRQLEFAPGSPAERAPGGRRLEAALYLLWALFWLLLTVIEVQDYLFERGTRLWEPVLWAGSGALVATFWLVVQQRLDKRHAARVDQPARWFARHLIWLPIIAVAFVAAMYGIRHGVYALLGESYRHQPWPAVLLYESIKAGFFFSLWLGIIFGFNTFSQWQEQRQRLLWLQKTLAEAQLSQLKAQLRPHFFFNALNTISALMHVDVARADRLLARLGDLLRASLQAGEQGVTSLREELRLLELYAQIMQERFADRVTLAWHIDPRTLNAAVPTLLLQPLLENAFKHAVERTVGPVSIEVESRVLDGQVRLVVRNSGAAHDPELREGVGLRNCREHLRVVYGDAASLRLARQGDAVEAGIVLPWREHAA